MEKTIQMYFRVYHDQLDLFILMLCKAIFGIKLFLEELRNMVSNLL
jgi:hypothetical protein